MKKALPIAVVLALLAGGVAYAGRQRIAQAIADFTKPPIPAALPASAFATGTVTGTGQATDRNVNKNVNANANRPVAIAEVNVNANANAPITAKESVNLAVPFLLQAPYQNWEQPYEDACEEASSAMIDGYWTKRTFPTPAAADAELKILFAWEEKRFGTNKDANAEQVAEMLREQYGYKKVIVKYDVTAEDVRREIRAGRPVITPAYGKALGNPNFKNGGPVYHMLVAKGFIGTDTIITNDPGTRKGADYVYKTSVFMAALHDWNGGDVPNGRSAMIVVYPN